jgi:prephenate dehydrogenase
MAIFKKVAIIGTGLIGGSIALGIKKNKLADEIVGVSRHKKSVSLALKMGVIDKGSVSLKIIEGADLLILAVPIGSILKLKDEIKRYTLGNCIITDVGSTKGMVVKEMSKAFPGYIGSHPLAGSEKRGVINSSPLIFKGSLCIMTPRGDYSKAAFIKIKDLWIKLGARVISMSPEKHDRILSLTSHLPHIVAFSLINTVPENILKLSSGGLKDTTRIAASDSLLWRDVFLSNRANSLKAIKLFEKNLSEIKSAIKTGNAVFLERLLRKSNRIRESLK